mmetsp:Transcript_37584/g.120479  ORF Transcript_37584/g.120479 Transcript_37584/m.120479 type:complete len:234 (+) Transcript_37584:864-1565(+)
MILSLTFAPPMIPTRGRFGAPSTIENASSSFFTRKPAHLTAKPSPTIDEWARCAVPNASQQYTSASLHRLARKAATLSLSALTFSPAASTPLPSSSTWKRTFSSRMTEPGAGSAHAASTSSPQQSVRKVTGFSMSFSSALATGASVNLGTTLPSGRPRWDARTTDLAPFSRQYLIEGSAPSMRAVLVMMVGSALSCGTLKSTRMKTRLPATSTESSLSLFRLRAMAESEARRD